MGIYSKEVISEVLGATDIVELIGAYVDLKPAGSQRFKGLSPFSNEKTPSFMVSRDRQLYHCFSTDKGGDALAFLMEHEGLTFVEALQKLADRAGIRLPAVTARDDKAAYLRTQLLEFAQFAYKHFRQRLQDPMKGSQARQYVKQRELQEETLERFGVGFARGGYSDLADAAREQGFKDHVLEASGLIKRSDKGRLYDFFRDRIVFPIRDVTGNVVAFGGRDVTGESQAKYINSPESPVYKKSKVLYGLYEAREALRKGDRAFLVEGYFDLLRCFDAGIENVVAPCGTALTVEQAALIRRYVSEVVMVYDGDAAGVKAAMRGTGVLTAAGLAVRVLVLPEGQDPDDYIRDHGAGAFRALADEAEDFVRFYVRRNQDRLSTIEGRTAVARELFEIFRGMDDQLRVDEYVKLAAQELGLNAWTCRNEYDKFLRSGSRRPVERKDPEAEAQQRPINRDDRDFLNALLRHKTLLDEVRTTLDGIPLDDSPVSQVLGALFSDTLANASTDLPSEEARRLYTAAAAYAPPEETDGGEATADLVKKRVNRIRRDALRSEAQELRQQIQEAERNQDGQRAMELAQRMFALMAQAEKAGAA